MNDLLQFMKGVGVGKNAAKSLSRSEAYDAMIALLTGRYHAVTFGAFFMGLRYKGETPEEVAGFLDAINQMSEPAPAPPTGLLNCAGAYDGKARTCNIGIPAALVTAAAGVPIVLHGARNIPTKAGVTTSHLLEALGINPGRNLEQVNADLHAVGIGYVDQSSFHPALHALLGMRQQMGKRTILNTLETLCNPFGATTHLGGFFHDPYAELICHTAELGGTTFKRVTLVKGVEGSDEIRPGAVFIARQTEDGYATEPVDSDALGYPVHISELSAPTESHQARTAFSAQRILQLLEQPRLESGFRNSVIVNAGVRLLAAGRVTTLEAAAAEATSILNSGAAMDTYKQWQAEARL